MDYYVIVLVFVLLMTIGVLFFKISVLEKKFKLFKKAMDPVVALRKEVEQSERWNAKIEQIKNDPDVRVVEENDNMLLVQIKTFQASVRNGTKAWCISTDIKSWKKYVPADRTQMFMFTKNTYSFSKQKYRRVGFTLTKSKRFHCCFDNLNNEMTVEQLSELLKINKCNFSFNNKKNKSSNDSK